MRIPAFFALSLCAVFAAAPDIVIGDFEDDTLDGWRLEGDAFSAATAPARYDDCEAKQAARGERFLVSNGKRKGAAESPEFLIERDYLNFCMNGRRTRPDVLGVWLVVDGEGVRAACGRCARPAMRGDLFPTTFDVRAFRGKRAKIRIVDETNGGSVAADAFVLSDTPAGPVVDAARPFAESHRPAFHFTAPWGWLADPDGLIYYNGRWLMAYQYSYLINSAGRAWGHAVSRDLIRWQDRPVALYADEYGQNLSGSGAVDWQNDSGLKEGECAPLLMAYTLQPSGFARASGKGVERSGVALAYSVDGGDTWRKRDAGKFLFEPKDNADRDPKLLRDPATGDWIVILCHSANNVKAKSAYGFYRSKDLRSWELVGEVAGLWENPDLFTLPLDGDPAQPRWILTRAGTEYYIGNFKNGVFEIQSPNLRAHWARHLYGAQTFSDAPNGRRVQMAWMNTGKLTEEDYEGMPFDQQMTFPVELSLRSTAEGPRLFFWPVKEIETLWDGAVALPNVRADSARVPLDLPKTRLWDIEARIKIGSAQRVGFDIFGMRIVYDTRAQTLTGPRGPELAHADIAKPAPLAPQNGEISLRFLIDRTSLEMFANGGAVRAAYVVYPDRDNAEIAVWSEGGAAQFDIVAHPMREAERDASAFDVKF